MGLIEKSFLHHKSLEVLNLGGNNIQDYANIVNIIEHNKHIKFINMRGSPMTVDNMGFIWLGLRQNISIEKLEY